MRFFRFSAMEVCPPSCREAIRTLPVRRRESPNNKEVPLDAREGTLRCNECKQRNYNTIKNKKNTPDKLELNKYCPFCKKHTLHTETK